jgi:hypothetical protein
MEGYDDSNDRYTAFRFSSSFGSDFAWGVEDHAYNPSDVIRGWRKGNLGRPWKGTESAARELARLLSKEHPDVDFVAKGELSKTQMIFYSNLAKKRRKWSMDNRPATALQKKAVAFRKCESCGMMTKEEKHCG